MRFARIPSRARMTNANATNANATQNDARALGVARVETNASRARKERHCATSHSRWKVTSERVNAMDDFESLDERERALERAFEACAKAMETKVGMERALKSAFLALAKARAHAIARSGFDDFDLMWPSVKTRARVNVRVEDEGWVRATRDASTGEFAASAATREARARFSEVLDLACDVVNAQRVMADACDVVRNDG